MNITRNVVRDLLTVYLAGEASPDTRALVEEVLERDPALREEAEAARGDVALPASTGPSKPTAERETLQKTRELLRTRTQTLVIAVLFTSLPLAFGFSGGRVTFIVVRDAPVIAIAWWAIAAVMWSWHLRVRRRLSVAGL